VQFSDFSREIFDIGKAIQDELAQRPLTEPQPAPQDLKELLSIVRRAAEDLMLCSDVDEAIGRLRRDPKALLAVEWLTNDAAILADDYKLAARRAYEATLHEPTALPFHAFCSYLIELCDGLELESPRS
jgi:hypothetical protein